MSLAVHETGAGPALVLIHGWGLHGGIWDGVLPLLTARYRVYVPDLPGHGHSRGARAASIDDCVAALRAALPARAIWLGWSLGGLLALRAAMTSDAVTRLITVAASPRFVQAPDWPQAMQAETLAGFRDGLARDYSGTLQRFLSLQVAASERENLRLLRAQVLARGAPDVDMLDRGLAWLRDTDLRAALAHVRCPSLAIAGGRDRLVPPAAVATLAAALGGDYVEFAHAGHAPFLTDPDRFAALV